MSRAFISAAMILDKVWWAKPHVFRNEERIDWNGIKASKASISPSTSEVRMVDFASDLYWGLGVCDVFGCLDEQNQRVVLSALLFRVGVPV